MQLALMKPAVRGRGHAEMRSEGSGQVALIGKSGGARDFGERRLTIDDRIDRKFKSQPPHVFGNGATMFAPEHARQMGRVHTCSFGQICKPKWLGKIIAQKLFCVPQPTW